ncbi:MAG: endonuclease/exonuclease/phosphatase family protein, partial [Acidobacteriota bacterium]
MRSLLMGAALAGALFVVGCDADDVTGPGASMEASAYGTDRAAAAEAGRIVFMTWNVFVGAPIEDAVNVEPSEIPFAAAAVWAEIQASDFAGRAASIAAQVAKHRPHFLALNEVTTFWSQTPSDFDVGTFDPGAPATTVALDFEAILLAALADRGLEYVVAVRADNFQAELPIYDESSPNYLTDLRLQDHDLLLVRSDVAVSASTTQNFSAYPTLFGIPQLRSLSYVDATVDGTSLRVAVTHLEPADTSLVVVPELEYVQRLQGTEVRNVLGAGPVVVMGDFNSDAYGSSTA